MLPDLSKAKWKRSTRCDNSGPNCVEVAFVGDQIAVRDSKNPDKALLFTRDEWTAFTEGAQDGEFNL